MAANYNRPKPIDPIWYRQGCYLRIYCACGRRVVAPLGDFARSRRISFDTRIYERSEEHTSELQSLMRISYAVFCLKKKKKTKTQHNTMSTNRNVQDPRLIQNNNNSILS